MIADARRALTTIHLAIMDDDCFALQGMVGLARSLQWPAGTVVDVRGTGDVTQAVEWCCFGTHTVDVLVLDMALDGVSGMQVCRSIREMGSAVGIVGVTSHNPQVYRSLLNDGLAQALLDKSSLRSCLREAVIAVADGGTYPEDDGFMPARAAVGSDWSAQPRPLSAVERRIVMMSLGRSTTKQIAQEMGITVDTVFSHRRNIKNKMGKHTWQDVLDEYRTLQLV